MAVRNSSGAYRGCDGLCCMEGQILLQPVRAQEGRLRQLLSQNLQSTPDSMTAGWALRRYPRVINSAISMASQVVRRRPMPRQGLQAYVINTRVAHVMGPLQSHDGVARFAQLYLLDPEMNQPAAGDEMFGGRTSQREQQLCRWFRHAGSAAPSRRVQNIILDYVRQLVEMLRSVNSYVRDLVNAMDVIRTMPAHAQQAVHLVLDRDARPSVDDGEHLRHHSRVFDPAGIYGLNALRPELFREVRRQFVYRAR